MTAIANLRLTAKLIPIIAPFMAKRDVRYYLLGVNVRPHKGGGAIICATDGHALGAILDREAVRDAEVTLRIDPRMLQACAAGVGNDRIVKVINDRLAVAEGPRESEVYIQAGNPVLGDSKTFPRYERVIPKLKNVKPGMLGCYGPILIAQVERAANAAKKASRSKVSSESFIQFFNVGDEKGSGIIRLGNAPDFVGVLMSMRVDSLSPFVPTWTDSIPRADDLAGMTGGAA
jgi:hypothetical protein